MHLYTQCLCQSYLNKTGRKNKTYDCGKQTKLMTCKKNWNQSKCFVFFNIQAWGLSLYLLSSTSLWESWPQVALFYIKCHEYLPWSYYIGLGAEPWEIKVNLYKTVTLEASFLWCGLTPDGPVCMLHIKLCKNWSKQIASLKNCKTG